MQRERGKVIGVDVHIAIYVCVHVFICLWTKKKIESYFRGLTFSNIHGKSFCRIYRLALPLCTPETLSLLSKSRIFLYNVHLALFVRRMTQLRSHKLIGKYRHLANLPGTSLGNNAITVCRPDNKQNCCGLGKNVNVRSSTLEAVLH